MPSVLWHCWLGSRKGIRPVKNWAVGYWHGYLSGARCRVAYSPADATATHRLFASVKSRLVSPLWYRLTRVVPEKRDVKRVCVCVCVWHLKNAEKLALKICTRNKSVFSLLRELSTQHFPHLPEQGAQQQTHWPLLLLSIDGTDGRTNRPFYRPCSAHNDKHCKSSFRICQWSVKMSSSDMIRCTILMCTQKLTWVSLI